MIFKYCISPTWKGLFPFFKSHKEDVANTQNFLFILPNNNESL